MPKTISPAPGLSWGFESLEAAQREDVVRAKRLRATAQTTRQRANGKVGVGRIDYVAGQQLAEALERGASRKDWPESLASAAHMRTVRQTVIQALLTALNPYDADDLRVLTVINTSWRYSPKQLNTVTAAGIKRQFRSHLNRSGVFALPGFTIGFLHGEFEPTSERYQLHYHLATTRNRADALYYGLRGRWGYTKTATGAAPIKRQALNDRPVQLSYLVKSYWPAKPVLLIDGVPKRTRDPQRIAEPYHSHVLVWLHAQRFSETMVVNGCDYRGGRFHLRQ